MLKMKALVTGLVRDDRLERLDTRPRQTRYAHSCQADFRMRLVRILA